MKDPNRPKRPTSGYFYYVAYQRAELEKQGKKITRVADWTKEVSAKWRELTDKEKSPFAKKAAADKERYDREMYAYKGKDANKPKRPQSAYFLWLAGFRDEKKHEFAENKLLLKAAGAAWKELKDEHKKPFEVKAEVERKKYEVAMREYHQNGGAAGAAAAKKPKVDEAANGANEDDDDDMADDDEDEDEEEEDDDE